VLSVTADERDAVLAQHAEMADQWLQAPPVARRCDHGLWPDAPTAVAIAHAEDPKQAQEDVRNVLQSLLEGLRPQAMSMNSCDRRAANHSERQSSKPETAVPGRHPASAVGGGSTANG
jgi:hypothetical protein